MLAQHVTKKTPWLGENFSYYADCQHSPFFIQHMTQLMQQSCVVLFTLLHLVTVAMGCETSL